MSPSTWTWTVIRTLVDDAVHYLPCSPQGEPMVDHALFDKSYSIVQHNFDRGCSAQPAPEVLEKARAYTQIQCGPNLYSVTFLLSCGLPQLFENHAQSHHALHNRHGLWCVLPKTQSVVPESWYASNPVIPENSTVPQLNVEENPVLICQPQELSPPKSTQSTKSTPNYGNSACTEASRSANSGDSGNYGNSSENPALSGQPQKLPKSIPSTESTESTSSTPTSGNSADSVNPNYPITNLPTYPISSAAETMEALEKLIQDHLVCTDSQRTILAFWILHTYCYQVSYFTPYLNIYSSIGESGKTTCMTILRALCAQPWWAAGVSPSTLTRKIIADRPTVLLDNWHTTFRGSDKQQITGFLLSGCANLQGFTLLESDYRGGFSTREVATFCPKAFAGLESLPPSLARRSIPIVLQRLKSQDSIASTFWLFVPENTEPLTSKMQAWVKQHFDELTSKFEEYEITTPALPGLSPHQQDCSNVLIALADTLGGHWPHKVRAALQEIFRQQQDREVSPIELLSDIRDAFAHHHNPERIFTAEVLDYLHSLDHRTWHEWNKNGAPMTAHALSRMLRKSFNIYSRSQRRGKDKRRGYQQSDFLEAWERYLPAPNPHPSQENQALSQCPTSNTETTEPNAVNHVVDDKLESPTVEITDKLENPAVEITHVVITDKAENPTAESTKKQRRRNRAKPPRQLPNSSIKLRSVSMSQSKQHAKKLLSKAHRA